MSNATSEVVWIRNLLQFFRFPMSPTFLHFDNQATLHIVANLVFTNVLAAPLIHNHVIRL